VEEVSLDNLSSQLNNHLSLEAPILWEEELQEVDSSEAQTNLWEVEASSEGVKLNSLHSPRFSAKSQPAAASSATLEPHSVSQTLNLKEAASSEANPNNNLPQASSTSPLP
jgi:hypothetical protein